MMMRKREILPIGCASLRSLANQQRKWDLGT